MSLSCLWESNVRAFGSSSFGFGSAWAQSTLNTSSMEFLCLKLSWRIVNSMAWTVHSAVIWWDPINELDITRHFFFTIDITWHYAHSLSSSFHILSTATCPISHALQAKLISTVQKAWSVLYVQVQLARQPSNPQSICTVWMSRSETVKQSSQLPCFR